MCSTSSFIVDRHTKRIAWAAECFAYQLIFRGMGMDDLTPVRLRFCHRRGAAMPGGLGIADGL